jgi:hypothetical protein
MKLYRFSPIQNHEQLMEAIMYTHLACNKLCKQSFDTYLPNAGNIGIFCHYDDEYERLIKMRNELTDVNDNWNQKYYRLHEPITIPAKDGIPKTTYTYLYIRRADPYRAQVGDADFVLRPEKFVPLKQSLLAGTKMKGARAFDRPDLDMIELCDPDIDALAYVHTHTMEDNLKKQSAETNL